MSKCKAFMNRAVQTEPNTCKIMHLRSVWLYATYCNTCVTHVCLCMQSEEKKYNHEKKRE